MATFSTAAMKVAAVCILLLCVCSNLSRPALASSPDDDQEATGAGALLRELLAHELAEEMGLLDADQHGDVAAVCSPACRKCLKACAIKCVFKPTCIVKCAIKSRCYSKATMVVA
ncbi:unnamed protein product [Urochloa humidicola]